MTLLLRQSIFISTVLPNSETWVNLSKTDIENLENIDKILLRRILDAPAKTSLPALYQELGCYPIKYIIMARRLSFLHHILNCDDDRLIKQVFLAQQKSPVKNDWALQVKEDLKILELDYLNFDNIKYMKKEAFKGLIEDKIKKVIMIELTSALAKSKL